MHRFFLRLICLAALCTATGTGRAQEDPAREAALKAAFVYNFAKFTEWPANRFRSETEPVVFCIGPASRLREALAILPDKLVGTRPVRVLTLTEATNLSGCHVLFVDDSMPARMRQLAEANLHGVLTVSDLPNFARTGGQIGFYYANNQLRFQINLDAARRHGIGFSSKLLRLADVIGQQSNLPGSLALAQRMTLNRL